MDERDWLAERFEANRTHLRAVAYRMLASVSAADDALQESWLRLSRTDTSQVDNLRAWLTTAVARVCLDMLRSRRGREEPLGPRVPEAGGKDPVRPLMASVYGALQRIESNRAASPRRAAA